MSYINMDHAGWVQRNLEAAKTMLSKSDRRRGAEKSQGWAAAPDQINDFHKRAFTILGIVGGGIYNAPIAWDTVFWHPKMIACAWHKGFGTFDFNELTTFVFLCHEARIRGHIGVRSPRHLDVSLSERSHEGAISVRHPSLDEAVASWRERFPADHSVIYQVKEQVA